MSENKKECDLCGLAVEVDGFEPVAGQFSGIIVGEVQSVEPHPDADKLRVAKK